MIDTCVMASPWAGAGRRWGGQRRFCQECGGLLRGVQVPQRTLQPGLDRPGWGGFAMTRIAASAPVAGGVHASNR